MQMAGSTLAGSAYRPADDLIQCQWETSIPPVNPQGVDLRDFISNYLNSRGEPANFTEIVLHCLSEMTLTNAIPLDEPSLSETLFSQIQKNISGILHDERFTRSFKSNLSGGSLWWLNDTKTASFPFQSG